MTEVVTARYEQRMAAIERANEIRRARAELKRRIAQGDVPVREVILDPPMEAHSWELGDLLLAQRRWGRTRMVKFIGRLRLLGVHVSEVKPVGALTERQRSQIALVLPVV